MPNVNADAILTPRRFTSDVCGSNLVLAHTSRLTRDDYVLMKISPTLVYEYPMPSRSYSHRAPARVFTVVQVTPSISPSSFRRTPIGVTNSVTNAIKSITPSPSISFIWSWFSHFMKSFPALSVPILMVCLETDGIRTDDVRQRLKNPLTSSTLLDTADILQHKTLEYGMK